MIALRGPSAAAPEAQSVVVPALVTALLAMVSVLPWGLPASVRFVLPMLPLVAIFHWSLFPRRPLPSLLLFACGLLIDFATRGPLGFWALTYIACAILASVIPITAVENRLMRFAAFAGTVLLIAVAQWAIACLFFMTLLPSAPFAVAAIVLLPVYAIIAAMGERAGALGANDEPRDLGQRG